MENLDDALMKGMDTRANKVLFAFFLALVLVLLGLRLWSFNRYQDVPYPNQVAASADGVAIVCGHTVYLYSLDGVEIRTYALPNSGKTTQLFWDEGSLAVADMDNKTILELSRETRKIHTFSGTSINAQFKVLREPGTRNIFVSDGANHRILVFDPSYQYLRSFGREGFGRGEFRFPNDMAFDESGNLLIANTKRSAIDVYRPDGQYVSTLVNSARNGTYRYPTKFLVTPDRLFVLENDGFLERGIIRIYDRSGKKIGMLDLGGSQVIGGMAAYGDTLYLTDSVNGELKTFFLKDLHPLGTFSLGFDMKCADWRRKAGFFKWLSLGSLCALILFCVPVFVFYLKIKKSESKEIGLTDLGKLTNETKGEATHLSDPILTVPVNKKRRMRTIALLIAGFGCVPLVVAAGKIIPPPVAIVIVLAGFISLVLGSKSIGTSGLFSGRMKKQVEQIVKKIVHDGKLAMQPGEQTERIALVLRKKSAMNTFLLFFTTKRLLVYTMNWGKVAGIEQFPFEAIKDVTQPKKDFFTSRPFIRVSLATGKETRDLRLFYVNEDYLRLLGEEFSRRKGKSSGMLHARLCLTCLQPLQGDYCLHCGNKLEHDWMSVYLSILFPGLGQLRNGEMWKGLVFVFLATIICLIELIYLKGWFFEGADISIREKEFILYLGFLAPVLYISNIVDAYRSSIRARKNRRGAEQRT